MGCLALNASFEPLTLVPPHRAVRLVLDRKAEILEVDEGRRFRSERSDLPCPTVIRLVRYVHVPRRFRRQVTNTFLFARDDYVCQYCGRHRRSFRGREFLTRDHVVPVSRGGENSWGNVVTACSPWKVNTLETGYSSIGSHVLAVGYRALRVTLVSGMFAWAASPLRHNASPQLAKGVS